MNRLRMMWEPLNFVRCQLDIMPEISLSLTGGFFDKVPSDRNPQMRMKTVCRRARRNAMPIPETANESWNPGALNTTET